MNLTLHILYADSDPTLYLRCYIPLRGLLRPSLQGTSAVTAKSILNIILPAALVLVVGVYSLFDAQHRKANPCHMTWSKPRYVPLPVRGYSSTNRGHDGARSPAKGYRLLRYVDGNLPDGEKEEPLRPRGIPVVFVPGHLGTYKQVGRPRDGGMCVFFLCFSTTRLESISRMDRLRTAVQCSGNISDYDSCDRR